MKTGLRRFYLRMWRVEDDGTDWAIIDANLRFAAFNVCLCFGILLFGLLWRLLA